MADKKKTAEGGSVNEAIATEKAAGKKAAPSEAAAAGPTPRMKSTKIPKLAKKNKPRLPRREKKARRKARRKAEAAQRIPSGDRG
jgi:hypothetical protein